VPECTFSQTKRPQTTLSHEAPRALRSSVGTTHSPALTVTSPGRFSFVDKRRFEEYSAGMSHQNVELV